MKLWHDLSPQQQLQRFKRLSPILLLIIGFAFWKFTLRPALIIAAVIMVCWLFGFQLYTLRVKHSRMIKR